MVSSEMSEAVDQVRGAGEAARNAVRELADIVSRIDPEGISDDEGNALVEELQGIVDALLADVVHILAPGIGRIGYGRAPLERGWMIKGIGIGDAAGESDHSPQVGGLGHIGNEETRDR